ncbi:MAG: response regulator, partial [Candidatus Omnitrophica bacterium]|nr:response regulator [Candidatus Omnitrophota bacterium]
MIKLLVVDDEPGICDILKKTFSPIGFTVLTATDGKSALSIVAKERPKVVLLDVKMLGMPGLEVLKEIKKIDRSTKVIMVTIMDDEKTRAEAKSLGADEFVTKPFISDQLEEIVAREIAELIKPKILVVDDEDDVVERLASIILRRFNCLVEKANDGAEALDKLKKDAFDVVLLDIKMPGLSGIDVIKEAVKFTPHTKILAISAYDSHEVADEALGAGALDF